MRKSLQLLLLFPLLAFLIVSCAVQPPARVDLESAPLEQTYKNIETLAQRVKRNDREIKRYFTLDADGKIHIKSDVSERGSSFEIFYDLENAEVLPGSVYRVRFYMLEKEQEITAGDSLLWKPEPDGSGLLLSMDDRYTEAWEEHLDLFDKHGGRLTFFIQGEYDPFCIIALERGHDVGYHSLNHLDLRKLPMQTFNEEIFEPLMAFRDKGINFSSFAYPFGFSEPWTHVELFGTFKILRGYGTTFRLYSEEDIRSGYIISRAIDNTVIRGEENFDKLITMMLRSVKFLDSDLVLPLTTHDISDSAHWGISKRRLEFLLKTASDLKLKFYLFSDFT